MPPKKGVDNCYHESIFGALSEIYTSQMIYKTSEKARAYAREYARKYKLEHREEVLAKKRAYYLANRERLLEQMRQYATTRRRSPEDKAKAVAYRQREDVKQRAAQRRATEKSKQQAAVRGKRRRATQQYKEASKRFNRRAISELRDHYVKLVLRVPSGVAVPKEMIAAKREHIRVNRLLKELKK